MFFSYKNDFNIDMATENITKQITYSLICNFYLRISII